MATVHPQLLILWRTHPSGCHPSYFLRKPQFSLEVTERLNFYLVWGILSKLLFFLYRQAKQSFGFIYLYASSAKFSLCRLSIYSPIQFFFLGPFQIHSHSHGPSLRHSQIFQHLFWSTDVRIGHGIQQWSHHWCWENKTNQPTKKKNPTSPPESHLFLRTVEWGCLPAHRTIILSVNFQLSDQKKKLPFIMLDLFSSRKGPLLLNKTLPIALV